MYVAYYGWYEIRVLRGRTVSDPVVDTAGAAQRWIAESLDHIGVPVVVAVLGLLLITALALHRRRVARGPQP